jgi:hypothetical protein
MENDFLFRVHRSLPLECVLTQPSPVRILTSYSLQVHVNKSYYLSIYVQMSRKVSFFQVLLVYAVLISLYGLHAIPISSFIFFVIVIMSGEDNSLNFSVFSFLHSPVLSYLLSQNTVLCTAFSSMFFLEGKKTSCPPV